jgi:hypothetical protein
VLAGNWTKKLKKEKLGKKGMHYQLCSLFYLQKGEKYESS